MPTQVERSTCVWPFPMNPAVCRCRTEAWLAIAADELQVSAMPRDRSSCDSCIRRKRRGARPAQRAAADELSQMADDLDAPLLGALATHAQGAVLLLEGDAQAALGALRQAWIAWQEFEVPYEAARARVLIGLACRQLGDEDTAEMELDAARLGFGQLGAMPDLARAQALSRAAPEPASGLRLHDRGGSP
jgi:hypothetical protein